MITLSSSEVAVYYAARVPDLTQRGKRWRSRCPIHRGQGYNFSIDPETGLWRCWSSCGRGGDIISLEMELTAALWREAVAEVGHIVGRVLVDWPTSRHARRLLAERHEHQNRELREAEFFRIAAGELAEQVLEDLPEAVPERFTPTQLLLSLRRAEGTALLTLYRGWRQQEPRLTAALVYAGECSWRRRSDALARFVTTLTGTEDAA